VALAVAAEILKRAALERAGRATTVVPQGRVVQTLRAVAVAALVRLALTALRQWAAAAATGRHQAFLARQSRMRAAAAAEATTVARLALAALAEAALVQYPAGRERLEPPTLAAAAAVVVLRRGYRALAELAGPVS
jgi:hypothetical protein